MASAAGQSMTGPGRWLRRPVRSAPAPLSVAGYAVGGQLLAVPDLVADPAHRLAQGPPPDLGRDDLGDLGERGFDGVGMAAAAVGAQKFRERRSVGHRQRRDARVVYRITQVRTPPGPLRLERPRPRRARAAPQVERNTLTKTETRTVVTGSQAPMVNAALDGKTQYMA